MKPLPHDEDAVRPHSYDGIQEYDKRMPNWWLFTLYGAMVFSLAYWAYYEWTGHMAPGYERVEQEIAELRLASLSRGAAPTDAQLWGFSQDPEVVASGEKIFVANCVACHGTDLKGGIGSDLTDAEWVHGGQPTDLYRTVQDGVLDKGMPTWGPVLGPARIADVVAFLISKNPTIKPPAE